MMQTDASARNPKVLVPFGTHECCSKCASMHMARVLRIVGLTRMENSAPFDRIDIGLASRTKDGRKR